MLKDSRVCVLNANIEAQTLDNKSTSIWLLTAQALPEPPPMRGVLYLSQLQCPYSPFLELGPELHPYPWIKLMCKLAHLHLVSHYNF